jgi:hypothetical protein
MPNVSRDLVADVIENGIRRPIELLMRQHFYPAALILAYSGMDTMAFLNMPAARTDVMRSDFIEWADKYLHLSANPQLTGRDLYAARCSVLHGGAYSRLSRGGECSLIHHFARGSDFDQSTSAAPFEKTAVTVSVENLVTAFFLAVDSFLGEVSEDEHRAEAVQKRLKYLQTTLPYGPKA